jgi:hypothetical protein
MLALGLRDHFLFYLIAYFIAYVLRYIHRTHVARLRAVGAARQRGTTAARTCARLRCFVVGLLQQTIGFGLRDQSFFHHQPNQVDGGVGRWRRILRERGERMAAQQQADNHA